MSQPFLTGLCSVTFRQLPSDEIIALAAAAGLSGIEWGGDIHVPPGDIAQARMVADACRAAGLTCPSYGSYLRPPDATDAEIDAVIASAKALGAALIRIWPGSKGKPSAHYSAAERDAAVGAIGAIADAAARAGLAVGLEHHPDTLTDDTRSAADLMAQLAGKANLSLYWQPRPGIDPGEAVAEVELLSERIGHLHVFQWDAAKARYPLATGWDAWRAYIAALGPSRWDRERYAFLEFVPDDDPALLSREADALRAILSAD